MTNQQTGLNMFLSEKVVLTNNTGHKVRGMDLYAKYLEWCESRNCIPYAKTKFYTNFESASGLGKNATYNNRKYYYQIQIEND